MIKCQLSQFSRSRKFMAKSIMANFNKIFFYLNSRPRFVRFIMTGVVNTIVHVSVFAFFLYAQISVVFANVLAFMCANIFSFFASSYFVFKVNSSSIYFYWRFLSLSIIGVVLSFAISVVCEKFQLHSYISVLGVVLIMPPVSYLLQKVAFLGRNVSVR